MMGLSQKVGCTFQYVFKVYARDPSVVEVQRTACTHVNHGEGASTGKYPEDKTLAHAPCASDNTKATIRDILVLQPTATYTEVVAHLESSVLAKLGLPQGREGQERLYALGSDSTLSWARDVLVSRKLVANIRDEINRHEYQFNKEDHLSVDTWARMLGGDVILYQPLRARAHMAGAQESTQVRPIRPTCHFPWGAWRGVIIPVVGGVANFGR